MPVRYVITTLKPGVRPEDYERWLREYDYRVAKTLPSIVSYRTHRIEGPITGDLVANLSFGMTLGAGKSKTHRVTYRRT